MRKCDKCGNNPAYIHFWESHNGQNNEGWLCRECAEEIGLTGDDMPSLPPEAFSLGFDQLKDLIFGAGALSALFSMPNISIITPRAGVPGQNGLALPVRRTEGAKKSGCPTCGTTMEQYSDRSRNGCEDCAPVYDKALGNLKRNELAELKKRLKAAIESQDYEEAARLRDHIKQIGEK